MNDTGFQVRENQRARRIYGVLESQFRRLFEHAERRPGITGVNLLPEAVSRLSSHPNIIGVKESGGDVAQIGEFAKGTPAGFSVLAGSSSQESSCGRAKSGTRGAP